MLKTLAMYKHYSLMKNIKKFHITDIDTLGQWYKTFFFVTYKWAK